MSVELWNHTKKNGSMDLKARYASMAQEIQEALQENKRAFEKLKKVTEEAIQEEGAKVKHAVKDVNRSLRKNPWKFVGGAVAGGILLGFILGKKK